MCAFQYSLLLFALFPINVVLASGSTCQVTGQGWNIQCTKENNSKADKIVVENKNQREILVSTVSYRSKCAMGGRVLYDKVKDKKIAPNSTVVFDFEATDEGTCRELFVHHCKNMFTYDHVKCPNMVNVTVSEI